VKLEMLKALLCSHAINAIIVVCGLGATSSPASFHAHAATTSDAVTG